MTIQSLFELILEYRVIVLGFMFLAPWVSYGLCILIPGTKEEPFILNLNLILALICLGGEIGYLAYASHTGGIQQIVQDSEFLFLLAPIYYVGVSVWVSRQRLALRQLPAFRVLQGFAMVIAAYLLLSWLLSKTRIVLFSHLPFSFIVFAILMLLSFGYLGYLKIMNRRSHLSQRSNLSTPNLSKQQDIERELNRLRKEQNNHSNNHS